MALTASLALPFASAVGTVWFSNTVAALPAAAIMPDYPELALQQDQGDARNTTIVRRMPSPGVDKYDDRRLGVFETDPRWRGFRTEAYNMVGLYPLLMPAQWLASHFTKDEDSRAGKKLMADARKSSMALQRMTHRMLPCDITNRLSVHLAHIMQKSKRDYANKRFAEEHRSPPVPFIRAASGRYLARVQKYMDGVVKHAVAEARRDSHRDKHRDKHHHRRDGRWTPFPPGPPGHIKTGTWLNQGSREVAWPKRCPSLVRDPVFDSIFEGFWVQDMTKEEAADDREAEEQAQRVQSWLKHGNVPRSLPLPPKQPSYQTCARAVRVAIANTNVSPLFPPSLPPITWTDSPSWTPALTDMRNDKELLPHNHNATTLSSMPPLVVLYRDGHLASYLTPNYTITNDTIRRTGKQYAHQIADNLCQESSDHSLDELDDEDEDDEVERMLAQMDLDDEEHLDYLTYQTWHAFNETRNEASNALHLHRFYDEDADDADEGIPVDIAPLLAIGRAVGKQSELIRAMVDETLSITDPLIVGWDGVTKVPILVYQNSDLGDKVASGLWEYVP